MSFLKISQFQVRAINALDLKTLSMDNVEVLQRMVPQEQEVKTLMDLNNSFINQLIDLMIN